MEDTKIKHVGLHARRLRDKGFSGMRERVFAEAWEKENSPPSFLNGGAGASQWLMHGDGVTPYANGELTQEEATVAATVVQWLGTSCGFSFLEETLKKAGYTVSWDRTKTPNVNGH